LLKLGAIPGVLALKVLKGQLLWLAHPCYRESKTYHREVESVRLSRDSYFGRYSGCMKNPVLLLLLAVLPLWLDGQAFDPVLDSLRDRLDQEVPADVAAEYYRDIMWYIFRTEEAGYADYPSGLDSLYQCCLKDKTKDKRHERQIQAEIVFFKGAALLWDDPGSAQAYIEKAIPLFGGNGDSANIAMSYLLLTSVSSGLGDSVGFSVYYTNANAFVRHLRDPDALALFHNNIGVGCYDFGRYADAALHYFAGLELVEKYRTPVLLEYQRDIYHNIAGVYKRLGDYDNSLFYVQKALESAIAGDQDPSDHYSMMGWIYSEKGNHQLALEAFQCVDDDRAISGRIAEKYFGMATCYRNLGDVVTALPLARRAVELLPISVHMHWGASAMQELAACEFASGMTAQALTHAMLAYEAFSTSANPRGKSTTAALLSKIYAELGDFKEALTYSELHYLNFELLERQQSLRQLTFGEFTRDNAAQTARREAEVEAQLNRQRFIRYALFAGLGVLATLAILLYNRFRFKQKTAFQLEQKNMEVQLALQRAETSEAFKSRFLANMSHEIRTPLHGISGFTELLLDASLSDKQNRWLSSIQYSTDRLSDVVNDILDISKIEAGEVKLREIPFSPSRLLADVQDSLRMKAEKNNTQIKVRIADDVPEALTGDPTRLYQILMNLAGNAVKFTENGTVTLSIESSVVPSDAHTLNALNTLNTPLTFSRSHDLTLSVADTGIGIPPERLTAIFESFQQAGEDTTARFGGTGLGLTIARELVRLHGSDIKVGSEVGKGSVFSFELRMPAADPSSVDEAKHIGDALWFAQPLRILLADDNDLNREIAVEAIRRHFENAEVIEARDGRETVELVRSQAFDLVLMDMQMPVMTGAEAAIYIRIQFEEGRRDIPIIALTASATPEEIENAIQSGMNRHLGKPFKSEELARVIAETLGLQSSAKDLSATNINKEPAHMPEQRDQLFDLTFLSEFTEGDKEQMLHFIRKFVDNYPKEVHAIEAAIVDADREALYLAAHSFRPQLEFVGMKAAASVLLEVERGARDGMPIAHLAILCRQVKDQLIALPRASDWIL
jgi:signal transduction histidine kinase/CheY-like chemotaxis protein/HPt (histidine-containing phosphotransfer) domain-containing protein